MKDDLRAALAESERAEELVRWLAEQAWLRPDEVAEHVGCSRRTVERLPWEVLPYLDLTPDSERSMRRYAPEDVKALPAALREWRRAKAEGRAEDWLAERRVEIEARDRKLIREAADT